MRCTLPANSLCYCAFVLHVYIYNLLYVCMSSVRCVVRVGVLESQRGWSHAFLINEPTLYPLNNADNGTVSNQHVVHSDAAVRPPTVKTVKLGDLTASA